jgi:hypothetical protein
VTILKGSAEIIDVRHSKPVAHLMDENKEKAYTFSSIAQDLYLLHSETVVSRVQLDRSPYRCARNHFLPAITAARAFSHNQVHHDLLLGLRGTCMS